MTVARMAVAIIVDARMTGASSPHDTTQIALVHHLSKEHHGYFASLNCTTKFTLYITMEFFSALSSHLALFRPRHKRVLVGSKALSQVSQHFVAVKAAAAILNLRALL